MLKRTLLFSNPYHLKSRNKQLVIVDKKDESQQTLPVEDIGFVVLEHPQITFTQGLMQLFAENNTAVILCNNKFLPSSMLLHLDTHSVQSEIFRYQLKAGKAIKNNLWQQTVKAKLRNQAALLKIYDKPALALENLVKKVQTGDKTNVEGQAAKIYWPRLMGVTFRRAREGASPNHLLNYGYTVLRAATARALSGSGLLPTIGIHHHNRYNAFCLADDIMEPYRPFVDALVLEILKEEAEPEELTKQIKAKLLKLLTIDVQFSKTQRPLMLGLSQTSASLAACFSGEKRKLEFPVLQ